MTPQQQVIAKCKAVVAKAMELYNLDMSRVAVRFDLKGRSAGQACYRNGNYAVRFNADMLTRDAFDHVLNNTVPHEFAHIACFMNSRLGSNHCSGWERVCVSLGGSGATRHKEDVVYGKGTTYEYTTDAGHAVRLNDKRHTYIQAGGVLRYRFGKGNVTKTSAYSVVGVRGRTLANPVVRTPTASTPTATASIVTAARSSYTIGVAAPSVPVAAPRTPASVFAAGTSKAAVARAIMLAGHTRGVSYEVMISAIMQATGHDRQLARATFKANAPKVGITM